MVGGGIGVTPYASILNDLVFGTSTNRYSGVSCKKVRIPVLVRVTTGLLVHPVTSPNHQPSLSDARCLPISDSPASGSFTSSLATSTACRNIVVIVSSRFRSTFCGYALRTNTSNGSSTCCATSREKT